MKSNHIVLIIVLVNLITTPIWTMAYNIERLSLSSSLSRRDASLASDVVDQFITFDVANLVKFIEPLLLDGSEINQAIIPAVLKLAITPFTPIANQLSKSILTMLMSTYTAADVAPAAIKKLTSLEAPLLTRFVGESVSKELTGAIDPILEGISTISDVKSATDKILSLAGLDSVECKLILAVKAGDLVKNQYPIYSKILASGGRFAEDGFLKVFLETLTKLKPGQENNKSCPALNKIIQNFHEIDTKGYAEVIGDAFRNKMAQAMDNLPLTSTNTETNLF